MRRETHDMNVWIDNRTSFALDAEQEALITQVIAETLRQEQFSTQVEVSVSIVDGDEIRQLNKKFRNIDKATDVLSFPLMEPGEPEEDEMMLGDIVINIERVVSQAAEYNHSFARELGFLTAHSMLHLLGYDHMNDKDEAEMFAKQETILTTLSLKRV